MININQLIELTWNRKLELLNLISNRTNNTVIQGPFKNMKILNKFSWGDGDTSGKLLGLYESELHHSLEHAINNNPDIILNIGCAEGYYGIGLALRKPNILTALFDINEQAISISRENAKFNNIHNIQFNTDCSTDNIQSYLKNKLHPLIIMDIEGHENIILDINNIPELTNSSIIVESHDCITPNTTNNLINHFQNTHTIYKISQGPKNPYIDIIQDLPDIDKMILCIEFRPSTMHWLYMVPNYYK